MANSLYPVSVSIFKLTGRSLRAFRRSKALVPSSSFSICFLIELTSFSQDILVEYYLKKEKLLQISDSILLFDSAMFDLRNVINMSRPYQRRPAIRIKEMRLKKRFRKKLDETVEVQQLLKGIWEQMWLWWILRTYLILQQISGRHFPHRKNFPIKAVSLWLINWHEALEMGWPPPPP